MSKAEMISKSLEQYEKKLEKADQKSRVLSLCHGRKYDTSRCVGEFSKLLDFSIDISKEVDADYTGDIYNDLKYIPNDYFNIILVEYCSFLPSVRVDKFLLELRRIGKEDSILIMPQYSRILLSLILTYFPVKEMPSFLSQLKDEGKMTKKSLIGLTPGNNRMINCMMFNIFGYIFVRVCSTDSGLFIYKKDPDALLIERVIDHSNNEEEIEKNDTTFHEIFKD